MTWKDFTSLFGSRNKHISETSSFFDMQVLRYVAYTQNVNKHGGK